jgi:hypothetical protein
LYNALAATMLIMASTPAPDEAPQTCARTLGATAFTTKLSGVPQAIREDLVRRIAAQGSAVADSDVPLLQTDAPGERERGYARVRFAQAMHIGDRWFVQLQITLMSGVRTYVYARHSDGSFDFSPGQQFGGPGCASIKAALAGVDTFGVGGI